MTTRERARFGVGGLLIAASFVVGAGSDEWTSGRDGHAPLLPAMDASPPAVAQPAAEPVAPAEPEAEATPARPDVEVAEVDAVKEAAIPAENPATAPEALLVMEGSASWYSDALAGRRTASGVAYDPSELIAAHRALPFGTRLRVTNLANDRSVEVRVIDRGPFVAGRILDLSRSAAEEIGILRAGHGRVRVEVLEYGG